MNCGRVSNQLSAYIDRELTGTEMLQIRAHLGACDACRAEYETLDRIKMMLGRLRTAEPKPGFVAAASRRFEETGSGGAEAGRRAALEPIASLIRRLRDSVVVGESWAEPLGLLPSRLAAGLSFLRSAAHRELAPSFAWSRLAVGVTTAVLAAALIHTTLVWRKAPDALVATSPPRLILGDDPLSPQTLDLQRVSDEAATGFLRPDLSRRGLPGGPASLPWAPVSFQSEGFRSLP